MACKSRMQGDFLRWIHAPPPHFNVGAQDSRNAWDLSTLKWVGGGRVVVPEEVYSGGGGSFSTLIQGREYVGVTIKVFWGDFGPVFYVSEQISMWKYVLSLLPSQGIYGFDRGFGKGGNFF